MVYDQAGSAHGPVAQAARAVRGAKKVLGLAGGYAEFSERYPGLCLPEDPSPDRLALAEQLWPAELIQGRLYLGLASTAEAVCQQLRIETAIVIGPVDSSPGGLPATQLAIEQDGRLPLLDGLEAFNASPGPVLVCCADGRVAGPTVAVGCVMMALRLGHMEGMAYVVKRKREAEPGGYIQLQALEMQLAG